MRHSVARLVLLAVVALGFGCIVGVGLASADVLVTRDGGRVETEGPWEVRGRLVVFTRSGGTLSSLRLSDIDLEASETATAQAQQAAEEAARKKSEPEAGTPEEKSSEDRATPRTEAAVKLTDADFTRRIHLAQAAGGSGEGSASTVGGERTETGPPAVLSYEREDAPFDQHVIITGSLGNLTRTTATAISLEVSLYDENNELIQMQRAVLEDPVLLPDGTTTFRAEFPDVFAFGAIQFRPRSTNLKTESPPNNQNPDGGGVEAGGVSGGSEARPRDRAP